MQDIEVIESAAAAEVSLDPIRSRILGELAEPASATMLAGRLGLPRQKVNYHLKSLESVGLVALLEERRKGNVTERVYQATAASYVISPAALEAVAPDPSRFSDQFSAFWMLALGARLVHEVGHLIAGASAARQKLATFAIDGDIVFRSAADRGAFAEELGVAVTRLIDKYHDDTTTSGRKHRIVVALHPSLKKAKTQP